MDVTNNVKYPNITVKLVGTDGNAFAVLGACRREMRKAKLPEAEINAFLEEAMEGDYNHLLATACKWFNVE